MFSSYPTTDRYTSTESQNSEANLLGCLLNHTSIPSGVMASSPRPLLSLSLAAKSHRQRHATVLLCIIQYHGASSPGHGLLFQALQLLPLLVFFQSQGPFLSSSCHLHVQVPRTPFFFILDLPSPSILSRNFKCYLYIDE